jgi:hypothetical protein
LALFALKLNQVVAKTEAFAQSTQTGSALKG